MKTSVWQKVPLKNLTTKIGSGATPRGGKEAYIEAGISLIRSQNVYDFLFDYSGLAFINEEQARQLDNVTIQKNDILLNITGASVGRCCMVPENILPARVNQHVSIIRINDLLADAKFVTYFLNTPVNKDLLLSIAQGGATREALTKEKIETFQISTPPLPTQQKISSILSAYDDLIENNTRRIKILEEMAQNLYREWFVNFRYPGHENVPLVESELGMIPEGWKVVKLDQCLTIYRGKSYRSENLVEEGEIPFVNLKCIDRDGGFRVDGLKCYKGDYKPNHIVYTGDIVMAVTDMTQERRIVARGARIPRLSSDFGIISMDLVKIQPINRLTKNFYYSFFRFSDFADRVKHYANGSNVLHLNPERITSFITYYPPIELLIQFSNIVDSIFKLADNLYSKNDNLRQQRDLLLPRLISGELDVEKIDI